MNAVINTVPAPIEPITIDQFKQVLPKKAKTKLTSEMVDNINKLLVDQQLRENFRENLLSYTGVMAEGRYKLQDYINAVRYVSYKLLGAANIEAYAKTFPDRYQRLVNENADQKTMASYSTAYNKTQLVNKIMEQTLVPSHVLNADVYQKAINVQAELMVTANSEKVRTDAANSLLNHLKMPEVTKIEMDIGVKQDKSIDDLRASTLELVAVQKKIIEAGVQTAEEVAQSKLVIEHDSSE